jgi:hypothetical protein
MNSKKPMAEKKANQYIRQRQRVERRREKKRGIKPGKFT